MELTVFLKLWLSLDLEHTCKMYSLSIFSPSIKVGTIHLSTTSFPTQVQNQISDRWIKVCYFMLSRFNELEGPSYSFMNFNHQCSDPCAVLHPKAVLGDVGGVSRGRGIKTFITETYTT